MFDNLINPVLGCELRCKFRDHVNHEFSYLHDVLYARMIREIATTNPYTEIMVRTDFYSDHF